jgi:hypothetical protein
VQIKVGNRNAAVTISAEIRKIVIQYRLALLLSMPKKEKFLFLTGLSCLLVNRIREVSATIETFYQPVAACTVISTVCRAIVKTGPPASPNLQQKS